jgi:hypothetical protein
MDRFGRTPCAEAGIELGIEPCKFIVPRGKFATANAQGSLSPAQIPAREVIGGIADNVVMVAVLI